MTISSKYFISVSSSPGVFGTLMYSYFFDHFGLPYHYRTCKITSTSTFTNLLNIFDDTDLFSGISVSMPYKLIPPGFFQYRSLDSLNIPINSFANTIYKDNSSSFCTSTDIYIFDSFFRNQQSSLPVLIYGTGAMSQLCQAYLSFYKISFTVLSRGELTALKASLSTDQSYASFVNATPTPLESLLDLEFNEMQILDLPVRLDQKLLDLPHVFSGFESTLIQFTRQFEIYTGKYIADNLLSDAVLSCFSLNL